MSAFEIINLESCLSTNSILAQMAYAPHGTVVATHTQTAGRGQRGNSWEAEPGKNLTFSQVLRPASLPAQRQFELSMVVSLAIARIIDSRLPHGMRCTIKWPNDIYVGLEKICGILIENKLAGPAIERAIAGIGINVNQTEFLSDAPNPTSVALLNGRHTIDLPAMLRDVTEAIYGDFNAYEESGNPTELRDRYFSRLMWTAGEHPFATPDGRQWLDRIASVGFDGILTLASGRSFAFKEISYVIPTDR